MQKWRRGGGDMPFSPKEFGIAIDDCIRLLRKLSDEQFNDLMNGKQEILSPSHEGGFPYRKVGEGTICRSNKERNRVGKEDR